MRILTNQGLTYDFFLSVSFLSVAYLYSLALRISPSLVNLFLFSVSVLDLRLYGIDLFPSQ